MPKHNVQEILICIKTEKNQQPPVQVINNEDGGERNLFLCKQIQRKYPNQIFYVKKSEKNL